MRFTDLSSVCAPTKGTSVPAKQTKRFIAFAHSESQNNGVVLLQTSEAAGSPQLAAFSPGVFDCQLAVIPFYKKGCQDKCSPAAAKHEVLAVQPQ